MKFVNETKAKILKNTVRFPLAKIDANLSRVGRHLKLSSTYLPPSFCVLKNSEI